ncbi:MAG: hypothetical protein AAF889_05370 [Cyanobacteria bacterium P01_D01_bin.73]
MNIRSSALLQSLSTSTDVEDAAGRLEESNAMKDSVPRSPSSPWLWIGSATLTGVFAAGVLLVEPPSPSPLNTPQRQGTEAVTPAQ